MVIGDNVFALSWFAGGEPFTQSTWEEICKNKDEWTSIDPKSTTIKRCTDAD